MARFFQILLLSLFATFSSAQTITFSIESTDTTPFEECDNKVVSFKVVNGGSSKVDSIELVDSGKTKTIAAHQDWRVVGVNTYGFSGILPSGRHNPVLRVYSNSAWTEYRLTQAITIYSSPKAFFRIITDSSQCFEGNYFGLVNLSRPGSGKSKIISAVFDLNNGRHVKGDTVFDSYSSSGYFDPEISVVDENGCVSDYRANDKIHIKERVGAGFKATGQVGCPNTTITFKNHTKTSFSKITQWEWEWTNGKRESFKPADSSSFWTDITRDYSRHGYHSPKLIIHTNYGCKDSITLKDAIRVERTNVKFTLQNTGNICLDDSVFFKWNKAHSISKFQFVFGDPLSTNKNVESLNNNPSHKFTMPGSYPISLSATAAPCPTKDTTICCVHVNGPVAITMLPCPPFCGKEPVIAKSYLRRLNADPTFKPTVSTVDYGLKLHDSVQILGGPHSNFPKNGVFSAGQGDDTIAGKYNIIYPAVDTFYDFFDTIPYRFVHHTWRRGNAIPKETMFHAPARVGGFEHYQIHDTIVVANPKLDSLVVEFANFSMKRRINASFGDTTYDIKAYHDDLPMGSSYHPVFNPSFPFASDSLEFFWDFEDTFAQNCISTETNPNPYCRYSREKLPTHIFKEHGCYIVKITATDTVTGCSHTGVRPIIYENVNAGFDTTKYSIMSWEKQNRLLAKGEPLEGMGIRLEGDFGACIGTHSALNYMNIYTEGLSPACMYWNNHLGGLSMIFDAEQGCSTKVYSYDANQQIVDSTYKDCDWISGQKLQIAGRKWLYATPGWKTVGVVTGAGGDSWDTFFYKNYIYVPDLTTEFQTSVVSQLDSATQLTEYRLFQKETMGRELDSVVKLSYKVVMTANTLGKAGLDAAIFQDSLSVQPSGFLDWNDSSTFSLKPGRYEVSAVGSNNKGCGGLSAQELRVGHVANFRTKLACAGAVTKFYDSVFYWHPRGRAWCDLLNWSQNSSCIDTSAFFNKPIAARHTYTTRSGYSLPQHKEQIVWDYNNDGVIDDINPTQPQFSYSTGGKHTVVMWSMDSLGQWQKTEKHIIVPDGSLKLSLAPGQTKHVCTPDFRRINYEATLFGDSTFSITNNFTNTVIRDADTGSFVFYFDNKIDFNLKLNIATASGCLDSISNSELIYFIGPRAQFKITSDSITCPGDSLRAINQGDTGKYEWVINGPNIVAKQTTRNLAVGLQSTGNGGLRLFTSQTVTDPITQASTTCRSVFPTNGEMAFSHLHDLSAEFEIAQAGFNNSIHFRIPNYLTLANYTFSIDGGPDTNIVPQNGLFTAVFPSGGKHRLCVFAAGMSCDTQYCDSINVTEVGIQALDNSEIKLYPNPAKNQINIAGLNGECNYLMYNILGETTQSGTTTGNLDVSSLNEGVYVVSFEFKGGWHSYRVVVKR